MRGLPGVVDAQVDFGAKEVAVTVEGAVTTAASLAERLNAAHSSFSYTAQ